MFSADLLLSGFVEDSLRTAGWLYGPSNLWPGPLPDADAPPTDCVAFDRIWTVSRADIERYYATGEATADLTEWPAHLGAPVLDGDGIPDNYDLAAGDQPDLLGDVAAWWVMNDAGNTHDLGGSVRGTAPLGVEVRVLAFAFETSPFPGVPLDPLRLASFVQFDVVNRRSTPLDSLRLSLYVDADIGNPNDDYAGVDTLRHLVYTYNGQAVDADNGAYDPGYGPAPPAWGVQMLRGPVALPNGRDDDYDGAIDEPGERARLATAPLMEDDYGTGSPFHPVQVYNVQRGLTVRGEALRGHGVGYPCYSLACERAPATVFGFTGDPAEHAFWSELNADGQGTAMIPGDRPSIATTGPARLAPGERATVLVAFPFARGPDYLASVSALRAVAAGLLAAFGDGVPSRRVEGPPAPPVPIVRGISAVRPNPGAGGQAALLALPGAAFVEAVVIDALGRRVAVVARGAWAPGEHRLAVPDGLPPGAYVLRVAVERGQPASVPFTVVGR
ncbi:hypothetical protein [Rubrivirga sp. IMCC45206]|uniref:hypothetical protein n=1 Tax=Rubrivirga sp. IMCC45206 TaxID=3391614 RepID=UPI0039902C79